ncbi:MAG: 2,3-bisphosphoglycerate-independent phosphoglycerate mutase [Oscillospiraceae bacterium]|nr:2,3-bisphosphoglycerate-independent phosphoglycerate mutase [Oscillospiraceae bacterium]
MVKKTLCIIFDGLGDRPIPQFGGQTPLEAAHTPNFDVITEKSLCGLVSTLGRGMRPGSDVSHLAIFGYPMEKYYTGRGPIEVAGLGIQLQEGDVAFRGNFGSVDENLNILDRRAGRIRVVDEFASAIDGIEIDGIRCIVKPGTAHRAGVVLRGGGLSAAVSDADPHAEGLPVSEVAPLDDSAEAARTARVVNEFMRASHRILDAMEANKARKAAGQFPANFLLLRGAGVYPSMPKFNDKYGLKSCCIVGGGLYKGIGAFLGMDLIPVEGATALPDTDVEAKFKKSIEMLDTYNFVFCHVKATDSLAEDGDAEGKKAFIEKADRAAALLANLPDDVLLIVTADHSTACELKAHSAAPVPVLFCNPSVRVDSVAAFSERAFAQGGFGYAEGKDIMPQVMNLMGKLHLIGA